MELKSVVITLAIFFLVLPIAGLFYTGFMISNGEPARSFDRYNGTSFIRSMTTEALNKTETSLQPSTSSPIDFLFGLPALFLQTTTDVARLVLAGPGLISDTFGQADREFPGLGLGLLGNVVVVILSITVVFLIVYFMRGYRA